MTEAPERAPRRRSARWYAGVVAAGLVLLLVVGAVWIAATGLLARRDSHAVRGELTTLKSDLAQGNEMAAVQLEARMQHQARAANARTSGPAWWVASKLPVVGLPIRTVRGATSVVDQLATTALPAALQAGEILDPQKLRTGPDRIDPQRLGDAAVPLSKAVTATDAVAARAQRLSGSTWSGTVNNSRDQLVDDVTKLRRGLADLSTAARLLPGPLGEDGTKRYFVAFETEAESRGLGGLPGDYAILQARHGQLSFLRFGSDADLAGARAHVNFGHDYNEEFGDTFGPETNFVNSDPSPNYPYAARIWMSMWQDKYHQRLDGAIATDPTALGYLLGATGGVTLSDGTVITQANAVPFFENAVYTKFGNDPEARIAYQVDAAKTVSTAVLHQPSSDLLASATALQLAADEGRLLVYTSDPRTEASVANESVGGILPETTQPFLDVVVNNAGANKLDYYLDRTVRYSRSSCAAGLATVTVTLQNGAPRGLPAALAGDVALRHPALAGRTQLLVSVYDTDHSSVNRVTVDGKPGFFDTELERGHPVSIVEVGLAPGQRRTLVFYVHEPAASLPLLALSQPLVRPLAQTVSAPQCGL